MLDDIRYTLEKARTVITNGWTKGAFFDQHGDNQNLAGQEFSVCLAGGVMAALDLMNEDEEQLWNNPSARGAIEALFTHIPWRSPARQKAEKELVVHVGKLEHYNPDEAIQDTMREFAAEMYESRKDTPWAAKESLNPSAHNYQAMFEQQMEMISLPDRSEGECKICYNTMLGAITLWNDTSSRKKNEVLDLVDTSIKDVIRKSEIVEP